MSVLTPSNTGANVGSPVRKQSDESLLWFARKKWKNKKQQNFFFFFKFDENGQRSVTRVTSTVHMKLGPEINHIYTRNSEVFHKSRPKWTGNVFWSNTPTIPKWPKTCDGKRCAADMCWNGPGGSEWTPQVSLETHTWPELCANTPKLAENGTKNSPKSAKMAQKWPQIDTNVRRTPEIDFEQGGWQAC